MQYDWNAIDVISILSKYNLDAWILTGASEEIIKKKKLDADLAAMEEFYDDLELDSSDEEVQN